LTVDQDPIIRKRILQLAVAFSTTALDKKVTFMLKVLEHILMSRPIEQPDYSAYNDAVKELQVDGMYELQRLASKMPDQLLVSFISFEKRVSVNNNTGCIRPIRSQSQRDHFFRVFGAEATSSISNIPVHNHVSI
jgi:exportin-5